MFIQRCPNKQQQRRPEGAAAGSSTSVPPCKHTLTGLPPSETSHFLWRAGVLGEFCLHVGPDGVILSRQDYLRDTWWRRPPTGTGTPPPPSPEL